MSLTDLIQLIPGWQNKTAEELYTALSAKTIVYEDKQMYTWAGIATICGDEAASAFCNKLQELGKNWTVLQLGGLGQQLYYLESIGVQNMDFLAQHVKKDLSLLEEAGIEATIEEISLAQTKKIKEDAAIDRLQAYREALSSWGGTGEEPVL